MSVRPPARAAHLNRGALDGSTCPNDRPDSRAYPCSLLATPRRHRTERGGAHVALRAYPSGLLALLSPWLARYRSLHRSTRPAWRLRALHTYHLLRGAGSHASGLRAWSSGCPFLCYCGCLVCALTDI